MIPKCPKCGKNAIMNGNCESNCYPLLWSSGGCIWLKEAMTASQAANFKQLWAAAIGKSKPQHRAEMFIVSSEWARRLCGGSMN